MSPHPVLLSQHMHSFRIRPLTAERAEKGRRLFMPRGKRGAWNGGSRESRDRHGCAYEDGSRASWRDGGYSAERSACSCVTPKRLVVGRNPSPMFRNRLTLDLWTVDARFPLLARYGGRGRVHGCAHIRLKNSMGLSGAGQARGRWVFGHNRCTSTCAQLWILLNDP